MIRLIQSVIDRVKAMFTLDAMLDLEQQFAARQAERRAELFRMADRYQKEGLTVIAADLRRQAEDLSEQRPLQTVMPFLGSKVDADRKPASLAAPSAPHRNRPTPQPPQVILHQTRRKGR